MSFIIIVVKYLQPEFKILWHFQTNAKAKKGQLLHTVTTITIARVQNFVAFPNECKG